VESISDPFFTSQLKLKLYLSLSLEPTSLIKKMSGTYSKACVYFNNGYYLEFEPTNQRYGFPPEELVKLNTFAKKRSGVLFVHVQESPIAATRQGTRIEATA